uniref:NADH dehydrogenase [ubiquinone] 1 beta subcomplex subunit 9 n=1 Tax=Hemiselmis tepida TaxID=464990 RepID=A0A7S0YVV2_9CRYP|mmetsp:Transcript_24687/g.62537  ORF Transcript_24687/g.62537 Transcript_24687/m.62537 type:complete len:104 (+) Transcript_24687:107-418(+)
MSLGIAHRTRVMNLYRQSLRLCMNVCIDRNLFSEEGQKIRDQFDAHKGETNVKVAQKLVEDGEAELLRWFHPDPYRFPYRPGGTKFQRNVPVPEQFLQNPYNH